MCLCARQRESESESERAHTSFKSAPVDDALQGLHHQRLDENGEETERRVANRRALVAVAQLASPLGVDDHDEGSVAPPAPFQTSNQGLEFRDGTRRRRHAYVIVRVARHGAVVRDDAVTVVARTRRVVHDKHARPRRRPKHGIGNVLGQGQLRRICWHDAIRRYDPAANVRDVLGDAALRGRAEGIPIVRPERQGCLADRVVP